MTANHPPRGWTDKILGILLTVALAIMGYVANEALETRKEVIKLSEQVQWRMQAISDRIKNLEDAEQRSTWHRDR